MARGCLQVILAIVMLSVFVSPSRADEKECKPVRIGIQKPYRSAVDYIRRGVPSFIVHQHFLKVLVDVGKAAAKVAKKMDDESVVFGDICIELKEFDKNLNEDGEIKKTAKMVKKLEKDKETKVMYLSKSLYPILPNLTDSEESFVNSSWARMVSMTMERPPVESYSYSDIALPKSLEILYDPHQDEACKHFYLGATNSSAFDNEPQMDAVTLTEHVIGMVIQVNLMGVKEEKAMQMLHHHIAYTFNGVRCTRKEESELMMPLVFMRAYGMNVGRLATELSKPETETEIDEEALLEQYKSACKRMSSYDSWGQMKFWTWTETGGLEAHEWEQYLLDDKRIGRIKRGRKRDAKVDAELAEDLIHGNDRMEQPTCTSGYVYRDLLGDGDSSTDSVAKSCCSEMCSISVCALGDSAGEYLDSCCSRCNQYSCSATLSSSDYDSVMETLMIVPEFGIASSCVIPIAYILI